MEGMEKRRNDIVRYVNEQGNVTFNQLKEHFPSVSDMTLRTDLKALDEQQKLVRIHGGAKSLEIVTGNDDVRRTRHPAPNRPGRPHPPRTRGNGPPGRSHYPPCIK